MRFILLIHTLVSAPTITGAANALPVTYFTHTSLWLRTVFSLSLTCSQTHLNEFQMYFSLFTYIHTPLYGLCMVFLPLVYIITHRSVMEYLCFYLFSFIFSTKMVSTSFFSPSYVLKRHHTPQMLSIYWLSLSFYILSLHTFKLPK